MKFSLPDMILRHEMAHAVMALREAPEVTGWVTVRVEVREGHVFGCVSYPRVSSFTAKARGRIALAGPAYCELRDFPKLGAARDLAHVLQRLGSGAAT